MSIKSSIKFNDEILDLKAKLFSAEKNRLSGAKTYSANEISGKMLKLINKNIFTDNK